MLIVSGMVSTSSIAACRGHHRQRDAGVPARRLEDDGVRLDQTRFLGRVDQGYPKAVLHAVRRVEGFQLGDDVCAGAVGDPVQPDQGRVSDQLGDVLSDAHNRHPSSMSKWIATSVGMARATGVNRCRRLRRHSGQHPAGAVVRRCRGQCRRRSARCRTQVEVGARLDDPVEWRSRRRRPARDRRRR